MAVPVAVRELTAADLDDRVVLNLSGTTDPLGVLSIYIDGTSTATDPAAAIDLDNRLVELARSVAADRSPDEAESLSVTRRRIAYGSP